MSRVWIVLLVLGTLLLAGCQSPAPIVVVPPPAADSAFVPTPVPIRVYVSGAVANPGVYTLPAGSIGDDAIKVAGGPQDADMDRVNLAHELQDQEQFHVPRKSEPVMSAAVANVPSAGSPNMRININTATIQELESLPKIGPSIAQTIIDYRTRNGPFQEIDDITKVKGIGDATFAQIKDMITVGDWGWFENWDNGFVLSQECASGAAFVVVEESFLLIPQAKLETRFLTRGKENGFVVLRGRFLGVECLTRF